MEPAQAALLEALSEDGLLRHWPAAVLARGADLVPALRGFTASQQGAIRAAQAQLQGGALYSVQLAHSPGGALRGSCNCPFAAAGRPCKHQAALALAWRLHLGGLALEEAPAPPAPAEPDWAAFVRAQPAAELAERLLRWAAQSPELRRELQSWQQAATPVVDLAQAKAVLSTLLGGPRELFERRKVGAYVRKAQAVLGLLASWIERDPALGLAAAELAWLKLWKRLDKADDSNGEIQGLIADIGALWLLALQAGGPPPAAYAERYLKLLAADETGCLPLPEALEALGGPARERLLQTLRQRWEAEPEDRRSRRDYLRHLQALGDVDERLRVLRAALHKARDHGELIDTLEAAGRAREALQAAEAALRAHPGQAELIERLVRIYQRDGWDEEVLRLRREVFARFPGPTSYQALLDAAAAAGQDREAERQRIWHQLQHELASARGWREQQLGELMLALWTEAGDWAAALDWLHMPRAVGAEALLNLARALPPEHDEAASRILKDQLARELRSAQSPYGRALALVRETLTRLDPEAGRLWLAWLRVEHRAKPRFIESLAAAP